MIINPIIDPYAVHYDSFAGDVYTIDTASITLTGGTLTADTITDGTAILTGGALDSTIIGGTTPAAGTLTTLTLTEATQDYIFSQDVGNILKLQGQTSGQTAGLHFMPADADNTDQVFFRLYTLRAAPNNEYLAIQGTTGAWEIQAKKDGTGSLRPMYLGMSDTHLVLATDGSSSFGGDLTVGGQIFADDGTAAAPGIAFTGGGGSGPSTGVYAVLGETPELHLATGGANRFGINDALAAFLVSVDITGTIRTTADQDWNLGAASAQADFAGDTKIRVTIGGTDYDIVAKAA